MTWKSVTEELPPCDGLYCVKLYLHKLEDNNWLVCIYDGYGFVSISSSYLQVDWPDNKYLKANYWYDKPKDKIKKYGKVI